MLRDVLRGFGVGGSVAKKVEVLELDFDSLPFAPLKAVGAPEARRINARVVGRPELTTRNRPVRYAALPV